MYCEKWVLFKNRYIEKKLRKIFKLILFLLLENRNRKEKEEKKKEIKQ